jgi:putative membrane protein
MNIDWGPFAQTLVASIVYCVIGIVIFGVSFVVVNALTPFSIRKEIEEDQNTALGIVIGSLILGLSIIIAAAVGA